MENMNYKNLKEIAKENMILSSLKINEENKRERGRKGCFAPYLCNFYWINYINSVLTF